MTASGRWGPAPLRDAAVARASAQGAEHGADEHANDRPTRVVIPRQLLRAECLVLVPLETSPETERSPRARRDPTA
jgi:hypothetical protein